MKKKSLNSQDLKKLFNDKVNDKTYEVICYTAYNEYPIKKVVFDDKENRIIIITEDIGG